VNTLTGVHDAGLAPVETEFGTHWMLMFQRLVKLID
jgi:hypothetical protein